MFSTICRSTIRSSRTLVAKSSQNLTLKYNSQVLITRQFHQSNIRYDSKSLDSKDTTPVDPKIQAIVNDIAKLNLLEVSSLVQALKTTLNIQDIAMPVASAAPAAGAAAAAPVEEAPKKEEKTEFIVTLEKVDASSKAKIIKEIKTLVSGINLMEAKKFVESVPKVIKENVSKADAEKMKKSLEALGAKVALS